MRAPLVSGKIFRLDRTISLSLLVTLLLQTCGALLWAGAADARLQALENDVARQPAVTERLARLEEQMLMARQSLNRIEHRLGQD